MDILGMGEGMNIKGWGGGGWNCKIKLSEFIV